LDTFVLGFVFIVERISRFRQHANGTPRQSSCCNLPQAVSAALWQPRSSQRGDERMKRSCFAEEQIIGILKAQEAGAKTVDVCRKHDISDATFYKYKAKHGGMTYRMPPN
jgi:putative transposase